MSKVSSSEKPVRIGMLSLGCPKTLVDSEVILGKLDQRQYKIVPSVGDCDIALLNTCSFIQDAQKESIDRVLQLLELKKQKRIKAVVVMGCMVQQFTKELQQELKEVDAFIGSGEYAKIPDIVNRVTGGKKVTEIGEPGYLVTSKDPRVALTPSYYRYLKISEGCDHICSFCTIPTFRGKHRSRTLDDVVTEAKRLVTEGAKEIILTGQDTTYFGRDYSGEFLLPQLLRALDQVDGVEWIRLLYAYPSCVTDDLIETIAKSRKVCHYLDMPLQHASDPMLTRMRRGITKRRTKDLLRKFRAAVPDLAIRTTFIVGFPGETEKDFSELMEFVEESRFERMGVFPYSREEGSHGASLPDQISETVKHQRRDLVMRLQQKISKQNNKRFIGKTFTVLIEGPSKEDSSLVRGRTYMDAPEIDGNVLIRTRRQLQAGMMIPVKITGANEYDLLGRI